ncbi:MAG: hypothetical protein Q9165_003248 [Trypethelium subeluteriae]
MASSYPPPPTPDQQPYDPYQHAPPISTAQIQEAAEAAGAAVQSVQAEHPQEQQASGLAYSFPKADQGVAEAAYHNHAAASHTHRQDLQGDSAHQKANRLRKACDSCSIRKVKCDESGPPCKACASLDIPCTFDRPSRRRGPPNKHAEAIKRKRTDISGHPALSSPSSPTHAAQALAALSATPQLSAEAICPMELLDQLVDDFFTYLYPLCPFPHEPSFRESLRRRDDFSNRSFLALLAAMISALLASYPRKPRLRLHHQRERDRMFPNRISLAYRSQGVCSSARGEGYLFKEDISVYDAATSYFLGLSYFFTGQILRSHFAFRECLIILETLKPWKQQDSGDEFGRTPTMSQDLISQEMGKRIFWSLWSTLQSLRLSDVSFTDVLIHPESDSYRYPPLPVERDDHRIHLAFVEEQLPDEIDLIRAFNSRVSTQRSVDLDPRSGLSKGPLIQALQQCRAVLAELPPQLTMHGAFLENGLLRAENEADAPRDPAYFIPADNEKDPGYRYTLQHRTQSRDLFVNQLSTRVRIVQGYNSLLESANPIAATAQTKDPGDLARVAAAGLDGMMLGQRQEPGPQNNGNSESHEDFTGLMDDEQDALIIDLLSALADVAYVNFEPFDDHYALDQLEQVAMPTQESEAISMQMAAELDSEMERRFWEDIDRAQATFKALIKKEKE